MDSKERDNLIVDKYEFEHYSVDEALKLGELKQDSKAINVIAAVFDLEGFTKFCLEREFEQVVPVFLSEFLSWFVSSVKELSRNAEYDDNVYLNCPLPFKIKFMGDGLLVLWDIQALTAFQKSYIVYLSYLLCDKYERDFPQRVKSKNWERLPKILRCGLAQGKVYSVGDQQDFVGPCINIASRLEKSPGATFAFDMKLIEDSLLGQSFFDEEFHKTQMSVRGISDVTTVAILKAEYADMTLEEKAHYKVIGEQGLLKRNFSFFNRKP